MTDERKYTDPRQRIETKERLEAEDLANAPRGVIYSRPAVKVDQEAELTTETRQQAAHMFEEQIKQAACYKKSKIADKQEFFAKLLHAAKQAAYQQGCVRYNRNINNPECSRMILQVIDAAIEQGLFVDVRSPKGSPKSSRLIPHGRTLNHLASDPWEFDPSRQTQYVFLRDRETKQEIAFDPKLPIPAFVQERLQRINQVNSTYVITYEMFDQWNEEFGEFRQLRPIHYARFSGAFDEHGRLYTSRKYGHQGLSQLERMTIRFNGEACVEPDYSGMHPRLLYHLAGFEFPGDPYALWGKKTTPQLRLMAKVMVNALINAKSQQAAISDCNQKMRTATKPTKSNPKPRRKRGKALKLARKLREAQETTGIKFKVVCEQALTFHKKIAHSFGQDMGVQLMWLDSALALDILYHFAEQHKPCLSCHDSFIVPEFAANELRAAMLYYYELRLGVLPVVKG